MQVEPYQNCLDCGSHLDTTTMYKRHAYCPDCGGLATL
jgi:predicted RNA-binding Zn-ribbon protein involved in translation (DUF1610 family)